MWAAHNCAMNMFFVYSQNLLLLMDIIQRIAASGFSTVDLVIVCVYLALLIFLGIFLGRKNNKGADKDANDYFLAGNKLTWWAVGASLIAANISAEQFIGMSGTSYADGIATAAYELMAAAAIVVVGKFLLPTMLKRKIFTIPQFLRERYNDGVGLAFSILWLFLYVFINLTSVAWLGALAIEQILGLQGMSIACGSFTISIRMAIVLTLFLIAGIYSIYGGLASVAWTDVLQVIFLVGGGLITAFFALTAVGAGEGAIAGLHNIFQDLTTGEHLTDTHLHLIVRESYDADAFANVPGIAALVGGVWLCNLGYWGFNQYIIQKGLAAKNVKEAQNGLLFAAGLKVLIPFIVVLPGVCAYYFSIHPSMFPDLLGSIEVADDAYPWLVLNFTPTGVKGITFAALAAAVISSLASMFNSTSTLFTLDIYKKYINKKASDKQLVSVGRLTSLIALVVAFIAVKPLLGGLDQAFQYIQEYSGFIFPGIVVVFGLGLLWKRASTKAAIWTAIATLPLGALFKIFLGDVPFMLRMGYVFMILLVMFVGISLGDKKNSIACELPSEDDRKTMKKWAYIFASLGLFFIAIATVIVSMGDSTAWTAYLNDIGFKAFFFFGIFFESIAMWLYSDSTDKVCDNKSIPVDISLFSTSRGYNIGFISLYALIGLVYVLLW